MPKTIIALRWGNSPNQTLSEALAPLYDREGSYAVPDPFLMAIVSVMKTDRTIDEIKTVYAEHSTDPFVVFEKPETPETSGVVQSEATVAEPSAKELQNELDALLDLVATNGIGSLNAEQKARLTELSSN